MHVIRPPDMSYPPGPETDHRPSWSGTPRYLGDEHRGIYEATKGLPGWQDPPDSEKLYELAFHSGSVILEVGVFGGRSAVVEMRGALAGAAAREEEAPQFYGVDVDPGFFARSLRTIADARLGERCLLYHGDVQRFLREVPIRPTMVFVDGDHSYPGVWADLAFLLERLAPGTPVLCHDYGGIEGVRRAVDQSVAGGGYEWMGQFAGSALLRRSGWAPGTRVAGLGLTPDVFERTRAALVGRYQSRQAPTLRRNAHHTPVRDLTREARAELLGARGEGAPSGYGAWPGRAPRGAPLPPTMPGGRPWPRISVVTPSFNQGKYIEQTLLSVLNQGYPNLEHIVMDGGSTDETTAILGRYRGRLACVVSEPDRGQSDAINKGMARATGEIVTWLNSDDMLAPGALAAVAMGFATSGADVVAGECRIHRNGKLVQRHLTSCSDGPIPLDDLLDIDGCWLEGQFFYQPEVMFTRAIWEKAGAHVREDLYHSMDYELWTRFAEHGATLHVIGRPVALFRAHPEQKTAGTVAGGFRVELPKARDEIARRLGRTPRRAPAPDGPGAPGRKVSLNIVLVNDLGYAYGAGIAHRRTAQALASCGHRVTTLSAATSEPHFQTGRVESNQLLLQIAARSPDLVVFGNLHGAEVDPLALEIAAARFPTVFILHDLWLLTGRCAYPGACRRYLTGCDASCSCPKDHPALDPDRVAGAWRQKRRLIASCPNLLLAANSRWALARIEEALAAARPFEPAAPARTGCIQFGLELDEFAPRDRSVCREELGLPTDRFILMSSASSLRDPRKGMSHLAQALRELDLPDVEVVCAGWQNPAEAPPIPGMRAMGYMKDRRRLAMLYGAADLFVGPSLEEAFGQVFIEAAACGTPSVGYPVGGVPEALRDGLSGRLAADVSVGALADAIDELYHAPDLRASMGRWARLWVENEWSMEAAAHRFLGALRASGLGERIGLARRDELALVPGVAPEPIPVITSLPAWRVVSGFGPWEGPYPARKFPRFRWALGPTAEFELDADAGGPARLLVAYRCFEPGQRVRIVQDGREVGERSLPCGASEGPDRVLAVDVSLRRGANPFALHFWRWRTGAGKPTALLVTSITSVPSTATTAIGAIETKPAVAGAGAGA